jgi:hypothetical protein
MKLKDLVVGDYNILDYISFFDDISDTKPYFAELTFMYGERELLTKAEDLFLSSDLGGVGLMFDLKSPDWEQLKIVAKRLVDDGMLETTTTKTTDRTDTVDRTGTNSSDVADDDFVVAYDETVDTKQAGTTRSDTKENIENVINELAGTDTTVKTGYDKNRMEFITTLFKEYPNYRLEIYKDIVNGLCIQGY